MFNLLLLGSAAALIVLFFLVSGIWVIRENESGLVIKKFGKPLPPGMLIALEGEAGYQAAQASLELMRRAHGFLPPITICDIYNKLRGGSGQAVIKGLWDQLGTDTVKCIADGARTLAMLWEAKRRRADCRRTLAALATSR